MVWRLVAEELAVLVIDVQDKLAPAISDSDVMIERTALVLEAAWRLNLPTSFTEHYPKGIGHTIEPLAKLAPHAPIFQKIYFDACREPDGLLEHLAGLKRKTVLVMGCEAHVCVMQTVLGLIRAGFETALVADGCGSRRGEDKHLALTRLRDAGCPSVSAEMAVFELLERGDHPQFKALLPLIRDGGGLHSKRVS